MDTDFHGQMFDTKFSFMNMMPTIGLNEDNTRFVIQTETFFDVLEKTGLDKMAGLPEGAKIAVPLDIALSLLRPDELEKLQKYVASYLAKHNNSEIN